jgi:MFS family permease
LFYVVSAILLIPVGSGIKHIGPRPFVAGGGLAMAAGVAGIGHVSEPWQAYVLFSLMGVGWACLSTTAVATTLAPWFETHQGRAITIASLGASLGGMLGPSLLLLGQDRIGFSQTTSLAAVIALVVLMPLALFVLRHRPEDMGLSPDGIPPTPGQQTLHQSKWTRSDALRTSALQTTVVAFGLALSMQIGLLTHQATLLAQSLSTKAAAATISATAVCALIGRVGLAKFADRIDARVTSSIVFLVAAIAYCALALSENSVLLIGASMLFGLTVGNVTTLAPIIVRREFGAAAFGPIFGLASCAVQLAAAMGPGFYGVVYDWFGGYRESLFVAAAIDIIAAIVIRTGRAPDPLQHPRQMPVKCETSGRGRRCGGALRLGSTARALTIRDEPPSEAGGVTLRIGAVWYELTTGAGVLLRSGGVLAALPMPLGSDRDRGLAGP